MNWDAIGAVGQMLGSIAVLVALAYLTIQVRQAKDEVRRSVAQNRGEAARELCMCRVTDERLNRIYTKARTALGSEQSDPFITALVE